MYFLKNITEEEENVIERVLDHKGEGDNMLYFIKWKGKSHLHNTWNSFYELSEFKGIKKVTNYRKHLEEELEWRKVATPEEIENADVARETHRQSYKEWLIVDRIIAGFFLLQLDLLFFFMFLTNYYFI